MPVPGSAAQTASAPAAMSASPVLVVLVVFLGAERIAAPVALLNLLDFLFAHPEVVTDLVNERLADDGAHLVLVTVAVLLDRLLEDGDAIGKAVAERPGTLRQRHTLIEPKQRVRRLDLHLGEQLWRRRVLDDEGEILHLPAEALRDEHHRFLHQSLELLTRHGFVIFVFFLVEDVVAVTALAGFFFAGARSRETTVR